MRAPSRSVSWIHGASSRCALEGARRGWRRASEPFQSRTERPTPRIVSPGMSAKVNIIYSCDHCPFKETSARCLVSASVLLLKFEL